jgi:hypothetical protein
MTEKQENIIIYMIIGLLLIYIVYIIVNTTMDKTSENFKTIDQNKQKMYDNGYTHGYSIIKNNYSNTLSLKNNGAFPVGVLDAIRDASKIYSPKLDRKYDKLWQKDYYRKSSKLNFI